MEAFKSILSVTFILVFLYLILNNSSGTTSALTGFGTLYDNAVRTLQGQTVNAA